MQYKRFYTLSLNNSYL
ncbi:BnaC01g42940D [Brassica napus]|uniref:BnaC01g42940D protein n=1 Tax=Brassica napus TaxID=3708 RepID=A0A078J8Q8_BRANA|nr:BnaC01g42940D [Brassica napus]